MSGLKKYVIVGNGTATTGCIEGIRSVDKNGSITVVSGEKHPVYCRPLISYYLQGKTDSDRIKYRSDGFYGENGCTVIYGKRGQTLDPEKKQLVLDDGTVIDYDKICIATGSYPFVPPTEGWDTVRCKHTFLTLDDALSLEKDIAPGSRVLVVGAGLIGLKCAEGLYGRVGSITVCDLADRVLSSILDTDGSAVVSEYLEQKGLKLLLGDAVSRFDGNKAYMKSGKTVEFDVVVTAVGVRADMALVKNAGGNCGRGITVDDRMRTSLDGVFAAGDCTESVDVSDGKVKVMALMPNAYMQGRCAGVNMAGGDNCFDNAIPMNSIGFFGLHLMTAGSRTGSGEGGEVYEEKGKDSLKKLFIKDGRLIGFILIGQVERAGIYTDLIRKRTPLDSVDTEILKKSPGLYVFSEKTRGQKLGGVV